MIIPCTTISACADRWLKAAERVTPETTLRHLVNIALGLRNGAIVLSAKHLELALDKLSKESLKE